MIVGPAISQKDFSGKLFMESMEAALAEVRRNNSNVCLNEGLILLIFEKIEEFYSFSQITIVFERGIRASFF